MVPLSIESSVRARLPDPVISTAPVEKGPAEGEASFESHLRERDSAPSAAEAKDTQREDETRRDRDERDDDQADSTKGEPISQEPAQAAENDEAPSDDAPPLAAVDAALIELAAQGELAAAEAQAESASDTAAKLLAESKQSPTAVGTPDTSAPTVGRKAGVRGDQADLHRKGERAAAAVKEDEATPSTPLVEEESLAGAESNDDADDATKRGEPGAPNTDEGLLDGQSEAMTPVDDVTPNERKTGSDALFDSPSVATATAENAAPAVSDVPVAPAARDENPQTSTPSGEDRVSDVDGAKESAQPKLSQHLLTRGSERSEGADALSNIDQSRLIDRVARAVRYAENRDGVVRLRLHPPELGSLRLELRVQSGVLTARLEADTPQAKSLLVENLPMLRERLSEQGVRIEQFDVDLRDRYSGQTPNSGEQRGQRDSATRLTAPREPAAVEDRSASSSVPVDTGSVLRRLDVTV